MAPKETAAVVREYQTIGAVIDTLAAYKPRAKDASRVEHDEWAGGAWDESLELLRDGWISGVPTLTVEAHAKLRENLRPVPVWGVTGSTPDVAAYLAGKPECMIEVTRQKRPSPVVRIGVDRAASGSIPRARMAAVGRNVLIVVESLRLAGIPAELWACQAVRGMGQGYANIFDLRVKVQDAGRPVDTSRVAYWIAHPSALRRTMFGLEETEKAATRRTWGFGGGYGHGYGVPLIGHAESDFDEWAPGAHSTDGQLSEWAREVLGRRAGVDL